MPAIDPTQIGAIQDLIRLWRKEVGLPKDPFHPLTADTLNACFIIPPKYYELSDLRNTAWFASQGGGKTTTRQMLAQSARKQNVFTVEYTDFDELSDKIEKLATSDHIVQVLRFAGWALLEFIKNEPEAFERATANFSDYDWRRVKGFLLEFLFKSRGEALEWRLDEILATRAVSANVELLTSLRQEDLSSHSALQDTPHQALVRVVHRLLHSKSGQPHSYVNPYEPIDAFGEMIRRMGFSHIFILVDNINANLDTEELDVPDTRKLLARLLGDTSLLNRPGVFWKFFLPREIKDQLTELIGLKSGDVAAQFVTWDPESLRPVLERRLKWASNGRFESLGAITGQDLKDSIDQLLLREANDSPKRLIKLGDRLFTAAARRWQQSGWKDSFLYINEFAWQEAKRDNPIDEEVRSSGRKIVPRPGRVASVKQD